MAEPLSLAIVHFAVTLTSGTGTLATYTVASTTGLTTGEQVVITGSSVAAYNGTFNIIVASGTTFTTTSTGTAASTGTTASLPSIQNLQLLGLLMRHNAQLPQPTDNLDNQIF